MKKIVIAPLAAIICGAAIAAETPDIKVFGVVDVNTAYVNKTADAKSHWGIGTSGISSSRLGFEAKQDVGNGLTAIAHLEGAIHADDGTTEGGGGGANGFQLKRRSTLGLQSDAFGEVRVGRDLTPTYRTASKYDVFGGNGIASYQGWTKWGSVTSVDGSGARANNLLAYYSPSYSGFTYGVGYAAHENAGTQENRYAGLFADYSAGNIEATFAYGAQKAQAGVPVDRTELSIGGAFDAGVVKVGALVQRTQNKEVNKNTYKKGKNGKYAVTSVLVGAIAPVGEDEFKVQFVNYQDNQKVGNKSKAKAMQFSVGYVNNWNDNFALYSTVAYIKNDKNNPLNLALNPTNVANAGGVALNKDKKPTAQVGFQVGAKYSF